MALLFYLTLLFEGTFPKESSGCIYLTSATSLTTELLGGTNLAESFLLIYSILVSGL
jgi:hypothetical protein